MLDKVYLFSLEEKFLKAKNNSMTLEQFTETFLGNVNHDPQDSLFVACGLEELFDDIVSAVKKNVNKGSKFSKRQLIRISWEDLISFMVDNIIIIQPTDKIIESRYISQSLSKDYKAIYNSEYLNQFLPQVLGGSENCL